MVWPDIAQIIYQPNDNQFTDKEQSIACSLATLAFIPHIFDDLFHSPSQAE
jgi:hypothetical protein